VLEALLRGEPVDPSEVLLPGRGVLGDLRPALAALQQSIFVASAIREADRVYYTAYRVT